MLGTIARVAAQILLFPVAVIVFYLGLGIGLAWPGVTLAGVTLSGPTAGTILWVAAFAIAVLNLIWIVRSLRRRG